MRRPRTSERIAAIAAATAAAMFPISQAAAICRQVIVTDSAPAPIDPDQEVLVVLREGWLTDDGCPDPAADAGASDDAGTSDDAGAADDAGTSADAGAMLDAGMSTDAGAMSDAGVCQPVTEDAVTMVVQPKFETGNLGASFALLMVTPSVPVVTLAPRDTFERLRTTTAPEVVTEEVYVEDASLGYQCNDPKWNTSSSGGGCSGDWGSGGHGSIPPGGGVWPADAGTPDGEPTIQTLGPYQLVVLDADDPAELATWLSTNDFRYSQDDLDALAPYLALDWTVVAVRVDVENEAFSGALVPIELTWVGREMRLPLGLSRAPTGELDLAVYVVADDRYDVPGAHVSYARRTSTRWGRYLTRSDMVVSRNRTAVDDPVAERSYAGNTRDTVTETIEVRIPSSRCPPAYRDDDEGLCGCRAPAGDTPRQLGQLLLFGLVCVVLMRRRRR